MESNSQNKTSLWEGLVTDGPKHQGKRTRASVVVVGGGVSGCACAAVLASSGIDVTVVSSALDVAGMPGYGPVIQAGSGGWSEIAAVLNSLPVGLRRAWINSASAPTSGGSLLVLDRRAVSIDSKRALEAIPGLCFRQGLVTDVRLVEVPEAEGIGLRGASPADERTEPAGSIPAVEVETAFGEVFRGDVAVLACGLAFRGTCHVGREVLPGGRFGELPADELCGALESMGARFDKVSHEVGPRLGLKDPEATGGRRGTPRWETPSLTGMARGSAEGEAGGSDFERLVAVRSVLDGDQERGPQAPRYPVGVPTRDAGLKRGLAMLRNGFNEAEGRQNEQPDAHMATVSSSGWLETFPPSPYWTDGLRPETGVVYGGRPGGTGAGVSGRTILALAPDGMALGETYVTPDGAQAEILPDDATLARMAYRVEASIVADVDSRGGFPGGDARIRVIGMAAGEADYLGSLSSGVRVAEHLIRSFEVSGDSAREITDLEERNGRNE